jgi:hypothetical protein
MSARGKSSVNGYQKNASDQQQINTTTEKTTENRMKYLKKYTYYNVPDKTIFIP